LKTFEVFVAGKEKKLSQKGKKNEQPITSKGMEGKRARGQRQGGEEGSRARHTGKMKRFIV
jgi:hypothetical protein